MRPLFYVLASGVAFAMVPLAASCALSEMGAEPPPDAMPLPAQDVAAPPVSDAGDRGPDRSCDASSSDCVSKPLTCEDADFCPVPTNVSPFHALVAVWGSGPNDVWAVGSGGTAVHWDGATWTATATNVKETLSAVWGFGGSDVWAAADTTVILRSSGFTPSSSQVWRRAPSASPDEWTVAPVLGMWGPPNGELHLGTRPFMVMDGDFFGPGALIDKRDAKDGGVVWQARMGSDAALHSIWGSSADDLWAVGDAGKTLHGTRSAPGTPHTWTPVDSQSRATLSGVWGASASEVWAVGEAGTIRRITTGAPTWEIVSSPTATRLRKLWGSGPKDVWAVGDAGTILHYDGVAWNDATAAFPVGRKPNLYGIWGSGPNDVWIVGDGIALHGKGKKTGGAP